MVGTGKFLTRKLITTRYMVVCGLIIIVEGWVVLAGYIKS
jgi:hypothetical protein